MSSANVSKIPVVKNRRLSPERPSPVATTVTQSFATLLASGCVAAPAFLPADFDRNGHVDGADLGTLLGNWNLPGITDLNNDGTTTGADLGVLLGSWG